MLSYNRALTILSIILLLTLPQITHAKSVYVISDTETSHIQAYKIDDTNLVYQTDYVCQSAPSGGTGAVGLAIDPAAEVLFVTFEGENIIELVNAKKMEYVDIVTAIGAANLAGIII